MQIFLAIPGGSQMLVGLLLAAVLIGIVVAMMRRRKPDPKRELLLSLISNIAKSESGGQSDAGNPDSSDPRKDHGPLGPGSFSRIALDDWIRDPAGDSTGEGRSVRPVDCLPAGQWASYVEGRRGGLNG